jgi:small subunit ribosomal protein S2
MKPYIFTERGGIHIIDLQQTTVLLDRAYDFVRNITSRGGTVLFVGTKKQCQDAIAEEATRVGMPYVSHRWLGGLLTNFTTIDNRIKRMHELRKLKEEGQLGLLPTKERMAMERELEKLEVNLGGVSNMSRLPDAVLVIDPKREAIATKEVNKLGLPLIGLCDTNCDPDETEYLIPGNDDAIRSCSLIIKTMARAVEEGRAKIQVAEFYASEAGAGGRATVGEAVERGEPFREGLTEGRGPRGSRPSRALSLDDRGRGLRRPGSDGRGAEGSRVAAGQRSGDRVRGVALEGSPARRIPAHRMAQSKAGEPVAKPEDLAEESEGLTAQVVEERTAEAVESLPGADAEAAE